MRNLNIDSADLILTSEAARLLGVSAQSVRQWTNRGRLRATKTAGGVRVFSRADVEALRLSRDASRPGVEPAPTAAA